MAEESINTYSIQPGYATLFYEQRVLNANNNRNTPYEFYCTRSYAATGQQWPQSAQNWGLLAANSREMCWVATVPLQTFQNVNQNSTDYDIAALLFWPRRSRARRTGATADGAISRRAIHGVRDVGGLRPPSSACGLRTNCP